MDQKNIEYLSGEVREILGQPPSWVTKWAFGITSFIIALALFAGFTFKYSEIIQGDLLLTTSSPPVIIDAPMNGILSKINIAEGDLVKKGDILAVFQSEAELEDIMELEKELASLNTFEEDAIRAFAPDKSLEVGELADSYENFISALEYVPLFQGNQIDQEAINSIRAVNRQLEKSNRQYERSIAILKKQKETDEGTMDNIVQLYGQSPKEAHYSTKLHETRQEISKINSEIEKFQSDIEKNIERIRNNNAKIINMRADNNAGTQERILELRKSITSLKKAINRWKDSHLVIAPAAGKVSLFANLSTKKRFEKDKPIIAIIPDSEGEKYLGQVQIPIVGSGKVKEGQEVNLKFSRYPFREYGAVKGKVSKIYFLPIGDTYEVEVSLDDGLKTTKNIVLDFHQQMTGKAEIVTEKQLFIKRLFGHFSKN